MESSNQEARILLAVQAFQNNRRKHVRSLAKAFNVPPSTLYYRIHDQTSRRDLSANSRKLTNQEESVLVREVLDLDSRAFPPRLDSIGDMANKLLADRGAPHVGLRWASNFVKQQPELRTHFTRKYDYQRALYKDPVMISAWFQLVRNTMAKYGIDKSDMWNFDETGFMMGVILSAMVVTTSDRQGRAKMKQPGNRE
jgi:hypothetical protein